MTEVIKHTRKLWERRSDSGSTFLFWCAGCGHGHTFDFPRWSFNLNVEKPTFKPSLKVFIPAGENRVEQTVCHLFLTDGKIQFLNDCPHSLKETTVEMSEIPDDYGF